MRSSKEIDELASHRCMQYTKMVFSNVKSYQYLEKDKIEVIWGNGPDLEKTEVELGDHSGFEISTFCSSINDYMMIVVIEIQSNIGEPTAKSTEIK